MSSLKKLSMLYAKSFFQNNKQNINIEKNANINFITSFEKSNQTSNIFLNFEELLLIRSILISSKSLKELFKNPTYSEQQKLKVILTIFPGLTLPTKSFLKVLTERNHLSLIPIITEELGEILNKFQNITNVKLTITTNLKENYGLDLLNSLKKLTNSKEIFLKVNYNPKLLGGLIIEYNSVSINATIFNEFNMLFSEI